MPLGRGTGLGALDRERSMSAWPYSPLPHPGRQEAPTSHADIEGDSFVTSLAHILPGVLRLGMGQRQGAHRPLCSQQQRV